MPRTPTLSDEEILVRLTEVFRTHGYEGASLTIIARETGLVRASLYHRFPGGKAEMAEMVMKRALRWLEGEALAPLADEARPPADRIRAMTTHLDAFYASGSKSCLLDSMSLGRAGGPFRGMAQVALVTWVDRLAALIGRAGVAAQEAVRRAEEAIALVEGALVLARVTEDPAVFRRVLATLPERLLAK